MGTIDLMRANLEIEAQLKLLQIKVNVQKKVTLKDVKTIEAIIKKHESVFAELENRPGQESPRIQSARAKFENIKEQTAKLREAVEFESKQQKG